MFITGTLYLKSNGGLFLSDGAVLKMSPDLAELEGSQNFRQNAAWLEEGNLGTHMILAVEQENIRIEGNGIIDGNGRIWVNDWKSHLTSHAGQMIMFCECERVVVKM